MWALLLELCGCKQGMKKPCNLAEVRVNNIKKELQVRIRKKKKGKERKGGAISHLWHWTGKKNVRLLQHDVQCHML